MIHPGLAGVSKKDLQEKLCKMYKVRLAATHTSSTRRDTSSRLRAGGSSRSVRAVGRCDGSVAGSGVTCFAYRHSAASENPRAIARVSSAPALDSKPQPPSF